MLYLLLFLIGASHTAHVHTQTDTERITKGAEKRSGSPA